MRRGVEAGALRAAREAPTWNGLSKRAGLSSTLTFVMETHAILGLPGVGW